MPDSSGQTDRWAEGDAYEPYIGRWSRLIAKEFLEWLALTPKLAWIDVGCGTGALSETIIRTAGPRALLGIDQSEAYIGFARRRLGADGVEFMNGSAEKIDAKEAVFDAADEGKRFPLCLPGALRELFEDAGLKSLEERAIDVVTRFKDFNDFWSPFLGGQGPAPGYAMSLSEERRNALRDVLRKRLTVAKDGSISLTARAWAVKGVR